MPSQQETTLSTHEALEYTGYSSKATLYRNAVPAVRGLGNQQSRWRIRDLDRLKENRTARGSK